MGLGWMLLGAFLKESAVEGILEKIGRPLSCYY